MTRIRILAAALAAGALLTPAAHAMQVKVTITSLAPSQGVEFTPVWVGFHDGGFDTYNLGAAASANLERLAEDGNAAPISAAFSAAGHTQQATLQGTAIGGPRFEPGDSTSFIFDLDGSNPDSRYISFLSMVLPSNDAFFGNGNPTGHRIFNDDGSFDGEDFIVLGSLVRDAGTEVNDEIPANTARLGQASPNTGVDEFGVVTAHAGFIPGGNILTAFPNGDFTQTGYQVARIQVAAVPEPETWAMLLAGLGLVGFNAARARRRG
ncbi:MAG: spondin domain-containing protein [Pseudomonadota bacterium]|nr:spondin domain-containing protein [Pseudomonadota bacterium]